MSVIAMDDEATWPQRQYLALRRTAGGLYDEPGLLLAGCGPVVFSLLPEEATPKNIRAADSARYRDWEEVRSDGWQVAEGGAP